MSDTPETDAVCEDIGKGCLMVNKEFAQKLERERDDALSQIFQAECRAERFCQERDMARELADQWRQESNWIGNEPTYKFPWEAAK